MRTQLYLAECFQTSFWDKCVLMDQNEGTWVRAQELEGSYEFFLCSNTHANELQLYVCTYFSKLFPKEIQVHWTVLKG